MNDKLYINEPNSPQNESNGAKNGCYKKEYEYTLRKTTYSPRSLSSDDLGPFPTYDDALSKMKEIARDIGEEVIKDRLGRDIIDTDRAVYWIFGTEKKQNNLNSIFGNGK